MGEIKQCDGSRADLLPDSGLCRRTAALTSAPVPVHQYTVHQYTSPVHSSRTPHKHTSTPGSGLCRRTAASPVHQYTSPLGSVGTPVHQYTSRKTPHQWCTGVLACCSTTGESPVHRSRPPHKYTVVEHLTNTPAHQQQNTSPAHRVVGSAGAQLPSQYIAQLVNLYNAEDAVSQMCTIEVCKTAKDSSTKY